MGLIQNLESLDKKVLMSSHLFGRDRDRVSTSLQGGAASRIHASISWQNGHWFFSDFSKNGTVVNGKLLLKTGHRVRNGDVFKFGPDESNHWQITDDSPPGSYLVAQGDSRKMIRLSADEVNHLPWSGSTIHFSNDLGWYYDEQGDSLLLEEGKVYQFAEVAWKFVRNEVITETIDDLGELTSAFFQFDLSADEEHIKMSLNVRGVEMDLGERAHNYLCLALARRRIQDLEEGYDEADQGWFATEELLKDLSRELQQEVDVYYLNLQVFRFRKLLSSSLPYGFLFSEVMERRKNEIRFGHHGFLVVKEGKQVIDTRNINPRH